MADGTYSCCSLPKPCKDYWQVALLECVIKLLDNVVTRGVLEVHHDTRF
jgi:hypothetical protein